MQSCRSGFLQGTQLQNLNRPTGSWVSRKLRVWAGVISSNDLKNGVTLEVNQQPFRVVEFLHVKPGKGAAFVRSKLKNCITGSVVDKTFRAGEMITTAEVRRSESQYTYPEGNNCVFMDMTTYEETRVEKDASWARYIKEGCTVFVTYYQDKVIGVEPPLNIELEVVEADAGVKGNTAQGGSHPVTLETGAVITAPLFVQKGDVIKIDTKREVYLSRV